MLNDCYQSGRQPCENGLAAGNFAGYCKLPAAYFTLEFSKSWYIPVLKIPLLPNTTVIQPAILTKNHFNRAVYLTRIL